MQKKFDSEKTIFLIDGSSFLYRAYYGMRPLHTTKGIPVQAVYVFCRMIKKLMDAFDPKKMALVWDSKGKTERHELYANYKEGRQAPPSDLFEQKELIVKFADLIGLAQIHKPGIEADDLINSLVQDYKDKYKLVIITSDKDLYQLLDKNVFVFDSFKDQITNTNDFEQKMEFPVHKLPFYFSILGDTSDNIPGVKGIGKIGATELVKQFENLDDLYNNLDKISKERTKKLLIEHKDNAYLSYKLFLLRYHKIPVSDENLAFNSEKWINARPLFEELEFKSLVQDMDLVSQKKHEEQRLYFAQEKGYEFKCITTKEQLIYLVNYLKENKTFAFDTETSGLNPLQDDFVGFSICAQKGLSFYIPFGHKTLEPQLTKEEVFHFFKPILESENYKKYLHHANFDQLVLFNNGIMLRGVVFETMIAASLVAESGQRIGLKYLSQHFLNEKMLSFDDVVKSKKLKDFSYVKLHDATEYAAGDSHQTFALKEILEKKLTDLDLKKVYDNIEFPLSNILFEMESEGINIDVNVLKNIDSKLSRDLNKLLEEIQVFSPGKTINLNSPKQIEDLLFNILQLPTQKKSAKKTGFSTDQSVLEELSLLHPVPGLLLKYRELYKLKSTYVDALPNYINHKTGKIHTTFSQISTATGRLSSFDPNLQNIPTDSYGLRSAFIASPGYVFLSADYSQIELRILAFLSQDKNLIEAFSKNEDIHTKTASYLFNVHTDEVTNEQRQVGKRINFSIMYGLTPFGLSKDLKIPFKEAKIYIQKYFEQYPGVFLWMEKIIIDAKEKGYVETYFGRRRHIPGIHEKNNTLYELARRAAINMPAQGTAADIMKLGMIYLDKIFKDGNLNARMVLQIHDELLIEIPKGQEAEIEKLVINALESIVNWNVPLIVTTRFGENWQQVTK